MTPDPLQIVLDLAGRDVLVDLATAAADGTPHVATAAHVERDGDRLRATAWFCPTTVENLQHNPRVAVVVRSREPGSGYQVLGRVEAVTDRAMLNGHDPAADPGDPPPQVQRDLTIAVERVLDFADAHHTDAPLPESP